MSNKYIFQTAGIVALLIALAFAISAQSTAGPRVFMLNAKTLADQQQKFADPKNVDPMLKPALAKIVRDADKALKTEVQPITAKTASPPSGDKHDYMTQAPYFWKNPDTKDGFPYIRKDGERNPEIKKFPDHELLDKMEDAVERLAIAYYFTGKEEYAAKADEVLRMWFLDAKTSMHPSLEFAQAVPGKNNGRGTGILESRGLTRIVDSIGLLNGSKAWTKADQTGLETWFSKYLDWLTTSKNGIDERNAKNNHGMIYDEQIASFYLFVGKTELARKTLESAKQNRIAKQIEPDGKQTLELARTKSWSYSTMNLDAMVKLAELGDAAGVDLWNFQTPDGRSIRKAIDFLYPFAIGERKWTYQQIEEFQPERLYSIMRRAAGKYTDDKFKKMMATVPKPADDDRVNVVGF